MPLLWPHLQTIVDRLRQVDRLKPAVDRRRAVAAMARHLAILEMGALPILWVRNLAEGLEGARGRSPDSICHLLYSAAAGWPGSDAASEANRDCYKAAVRVAWTPAENQLIQTVMSSVRQGAPHPLSAGQTAAWAVAWNVPGCAPVPRTPWKGKLIASLMPFIDAFEAGLWVYWILKDGVILLPRPSLWTPRERLHNESGPAVLWPDGTPEWSWNGVRVPRHVIEDPRLIKFHDILTETNLEVRRIMLERYGIARFLCDLRARPRQSDSFGEIYRIELPHEGPFVVVRVKNSTPEPDGSRHEYFLRVPPHVRTAREAVAWTFGMSSEEYIPSIET